MLERKLSCKPSYHRDSCWKANWCKILNGFFYIGNCIGEILAEKISIIKNQE